MTRGLISIGTNSTRALVADLDKSPPLTLLHRSIGTRIGEGLRERGHLEETAMQRTLDAIAAHAQAIRELTPDLQVIATSALRRADNERDFEERVRAITGTGIHIISGEEEASCSFAGAVSGVDAREDERFGVLDVGGGSSEYAVGPKTGPQRVVSCEIGAVRLTEHFGALAGKNGPVSAQVLEEAAGYAEKALEPALALSAVDRVILVGGSATTTVALVRGRRDVFAYGQLSVEDLDEWIERLAKAPLPERRELPGMNPQRADILLGGLLIIRTFCSARQYGRTLVSVSDVLLGYLLRHPAER